MERLATTDRRRRPAFLRSADAARDDVQEHAGDLPILTRAISHIGNAAGTCDFRRHTCSSRIVLSRRLPGGFVARRRLYIK